MCLLSLFPSVGSSFPFPHNLLLRDPVHLLEEFPLVLDFVDCTLFVQVSQFLCISCKLAAKWKGLIGSGFSAFGKDDGWWWVLLAGKCLVVTLSMMLAGIGALCLDPLIH